MRSALLLLLLAMSAIAQVTDARRMGGPVEIKTWRFQAGDDPRWAASDFDDSSWRVIQGDKPWDQLGLTADGYLWLRTRVLIPENAGRLGLGLTLIGPHEIFANGKSIGVAGEFPPRGLLYAEAPHLYPFDAPAGHFVELAIRVWLWPALNRIGTLPGPVFIGPADVMSNAHELTMRQIIDGQIGSYVLEIVYTVLAAGLIILFLRQRKQSEYLWLSLAIIPAVLMGIVDSRTVMVTTDTRLVNYFNSMASAFSAVCLLEFVFRFLGQAMPKWLRVYQFVLALNILRSYVAWHDWISLSQANVAALLLYLPYWFATPGIVLWRYVRGNKEAGLLAIPLLLMFGIDMSNSIHWVLWRLRLRHTVTAFVPDLKLGLVTIAPDSITHFLFFLSIAALILYRFQKVRAEQAQAQAELEAARDMQEVMVPSSVASPGFHIESAYIPAQEVGGDFFQLFPEDGSVLIVIGDVSGKGLKAAMLVSLILGLLRRTVKDTRNPAKILTEVNELLAGHTDGRFATCCCALIYRDGRMAIANAGHLSPYCNGVEIQTPGNVPLGLTPAIEYEEVGFRIPAGQRVLFVSDGVVEARSKSGELYGFERTRVISVEPAAEIAHAARQFGQEDDITVVGIQPAAAFG
ncbi:MAG: serine/threonine-protein phosphatase [Acidobacteriaceae bacterium]|nr:serine/threonine-protein phosphatase [Acidobacteriaceae bacterium]